MSGVRSRILQTWFLTAAMMLVAGCENQQPPAEKQISCATADPSKKADGVTFIFDLGRKFVVRASGSDHRPMPLAWNRYVYQFRDAAGAVFTLNRFDGSLQRHFSAKPAGRSKGMPVESWMCKSQKVGQAL